MQSLNGHRPLTKMDTSMSSKCVQSASLWLCYPFVCFHLLLKWMKSTNGFSTSLFPCTLCLKKKKKWKKWNYALLMFSDFPRLRSSSLVGQCPINHVSWSGLINVHMYIKAPVFEKHYFRPLCSIQKAHRQWLPFSVALPPILYELHTHIYCICPDSLYIVLWLYNSSDVHMRWPSLLWANQCAQKFVPGS